MSGDGDSHRGARLRQGISHGVQTALMPPSTARHCPVIWRDASEARKTTAPFKSSSPPMRCSGALAITASATFSSRPADIFEGKKPGQMAFTLMLYLPHSEA